MSKRVTGFLNWKFARQRTLGGDALGRLVRHMRDQDPDFMAVTGDLTNLSLPDEHDSAHDWLASLGDPGQVCVSPGNHDAYVRGALAAALERWGDYVRGETVDTEMFPFVRRVGEMAVVCCSSAVATGPGFASGHFSADQAERFARIMDLLGEAGYFRVVMIHHPPNPELWHPRYGLWGAKRFRAVISETGAELILHGHTHKSSIHAIRGPRGEVPVIGVAAAAAAQTGNGGDDPARYNLFKVERVGSSWSCVMREYGFQRLSPDIVLRLQVRIY